MDSVVDRLRGLRSGTETVYILTRKTGRNRTAEAMRRIMSILSQAIPEYDVETESLAEAAPKGKAEAAEAGNEELGENHGKSPGGAITQNAGSPLSGDGYFSREPSRGCQS